MNRLIPSIDLIKEIELSEIDYMTDRMLAIQSRDKNPEGIDIQQFGNAVCFYSKTMPWPTFNTVKGLTNNDLEHLDAIIDFYRQRDRKVQFEVIPSVVDQNFLKRLTDLGMYTSGFHSSLIIKPEEKRITQIISKFKNLKRINSSYTRPFIAGGPVCRMTVSLTSPRIIRFFITVQVGNFTSHMSMTSLQR